MITLISGIPGAGKTTISRLLAASWPRSVHLEGDRIGAEFIVNGRVDPGAEPADESERQLELRRRNTSLLADSFADSGFTVVIDDVILWPGGLRLYQRLLRSRPLRFVVLAPDLDVVAVRDAGRDKHFFEVWKHLDADLRGWTDQTGAAAGQLPADRRASGARDPEPVGRSTRQRPGRRPNGTCRSVAGRSAPLSIAPSPLVDHDALHGNPDRIQRICVQGAMINTGCGALTANRDSERRTSAK